MFASVKTAPLRPGLAAVSNSVSVFDGKYPGGGNVTAAVFHSGKEAFVFDSLLYPDDTHALLQEAKKSGLGVKGLINTHWHIDHTAGNQLFHDTQHIISHSLCGGLMRTEGKDDPEWAFGRLKLEEKDRIRSTYPNEAVGDGSTLQVGSREMEIIHTPGHTPDSIIGWEKEEGVLIAGDTVMELPFFGYGESRALIESLKKIRSIAGARGKIVQGHGGVCAGERIADDIRYLEEVRRRTAEYVGSGKSAEQASAGIKLEDCVTKARFALLSERFGSLLWCHPSNVERAFSELAEKKA